MAMPVGCERQRLISDRRRCSTLFCTG
jgi:hypothetical protein